MTVMTPCCRNANKKTYFDVNKQGSVTSSLDRMKGQEGVGTSVGVPRCIVVYLYKLHTSTRTAAIRDVYTLSADLVHHWVCD